MNVSVVIPSYNYERFLRECVQSVWAQTVRPLEVIVSDDGSSDGSVALARQLAESAPVPTEVLASEHVGLHESLNRSLRRARGDCVAFIAADDRWTPTFLERQLAHFTADPRVVLSHCEYSVIDASGRPLPDQRSSMIAASGDCLVDLLRGRCVMKTGPVVSRAVALSFGGFDPAYPQEDWTFYLRCAARGTLGYSSEALVERRIHGENSTVRFAAVQTYELAMRAAAVPVLKELAPNEAILKEALAFHLGVPIRSALFHGQFRAAANVMRGALEHHPEIRAELLQAWVRGLASIAWDRSIRKAGGGAALAKVESRIRRALGW
jgi:glycosyltransferase involved in cell wall biosynthesis